MNKWQQDFINKMTKHYLITALWSTIDFLGEDQEGPLDDKSGVEDISEEFKQEALKDCASFYALTMELYESDEDDAEQIGHDFWLTRNRHGAGFWDGDYKRGQAITDLVHKLYPENDDALREAIIQKENDK